MEKTRTILIEIAPARTVLSANAEENLNTTETNCPVEEATAPSLHEESNVGRYPTRSRNKLSYIEYVDNSANH